MYKFITLVGTGIGGLTLANYMNFPLEAGLLTTFIVASIHIEKELSVFYRQDSEGVPRFMPGALLEQLKWPLRNHEAWYPNFLDLNYYAVLGGSVLGYTAMQKINQYVE